MTSHHLDPALTILVSLGVFVLTGFIYSMLKDFKNGKIRKFGVRAKVDAIINSVNSSLTEVDYFKDRRK